MAVFPSWWRGCAAALLSVALLGLGSGCKSSSKSTPENEITISGKVTYLRAPLQKSADGIPTGIETDASKFTSLPARGIKVRLFQGQQQLNPDGVTKTTAWVVIGNTVTDSTGAYSFGSVPEGNLTFVELLSAGQQPGGHSSSIQVVGDEKGIDSDVPETNRVIYSIRKGLDGATSSTSATPGVLASASATVDFNVGATDSWLLSPPSWYYPSTGPFPYPPTLAVGSKPLAILDSAYTFGLNCGDPTPYKTSGTLDLHYRPGVTHPRGTFTEYDASSYPRSYDGVGFRYFGSVAGGAPFADDAYNEAVLFAMMARNFMTGQGQVTLLPTGTALPSLAPDLAMVDGLPDAIAAGLLKTPYLADPALASRFPAKDIRVLAGAPKTAFSAPLVRALTWELILKANSITSPGVPADWANIDPTRLLRFFLLTKPTITSGSTTTASDVPGLFIQLGRLQESQTSSDSANLQAIFPDATLTSILAPFGLTWPGTAALPNNTTNWSTDPDSLVSPLPAITLTMGEAQKITEFYLDGAKALQQRQVYPNCSKGEVFYAMFALTKDRAYQMSITTPGGLPAGALVEVVLDGVTGHPYLFGGTNDSSYRVALLGNHSDLTTPNWHRLRMRVLSPAVQQPDLQVTLKLDLAN